jgi:hypothetical protein
VYISVELNYRNTFKLKSKLWITGCSGTEVLVAGGPGQPRRSLLIAENAMSCHSAAISPDPTL